MSQKFPFEHFLKSEQNMPIQKPFAAPQKEQPPQSPLEEFSANELLEINKGILSYLKELVPTQKYCAYFENTFSLATIQETKVEFLVSTPFIKNMLETHYKNQITDSIQNVLGKTYDVTITINKSNKSLSSNKNNILNTINLEKTNSNYDRPKNTKDVKFVLTPTKDDIIDQVDSVYLNHVESDNSSSILIDHKKTFDNFIVGPSNNMAYATSKAVALNPGNQGKYPSLYLYSDSGLGKTHLLHAVANGIRQNHPALNIYMITGQDFTQEMVNSIQNNRLSEFQKKYTEKVDVLMIDDIHELKNKKGTQNAFFHIFNALYNKGKQLIFTSDKPPKEIDGIEERIKTRLQWGLVVDIQRPDLETRMAILKKKAETLDIYISDDIIHLIACSVKSSIRELEGSLIKLSAYSEVMKVEMDIEMAKEQLKLNENSEIKTATLENIAKSCSHHFKIPVADLKSKARKKEIAEVRHVAMYLSQKLVGATLHEIGKFYGDRDHTSVLHAIKRIKERLKNNDSELSKALTIIENNI